MSSANRDNAALDFESALTQGGHHATISPESLELMGKQAANMFLDKKIPLNTSIAKLASEHADISNDQVKRIVEFANTAVYLAKHDQAKTAGADSSYPQFELADSGRIIQDLAGGARSTVITPTDLDYARQPTKKEKVASAEAALLLEEAFGVGQFAEKTASPNYSIDSVTDDFLALKSNLTAAQQHLEEQGGRFDRMQKEASEKYYDLVKRHMLGDGDFVDVMAAAQSVGIEQEKVAEVLRPVIERLLTEKVASLAKLSSGVNRLEKVAHRTVNPEHPLVVTVGEIAGLNHEMKKVATALSSLNEQLTQVKGYIREKIHAGATS